MTRRTAPLLAAASLGAWLLAPRAAHAEPTEPGELATPLITAFGCELCHGYDNAPVDMDDPAYSPLHTWGGSLMANSARDPVFWAGVAVANDDSPGGTELCIRCHSPRAFLEENGGALSMDDLTTDQEAGVECEACHRMMEDPGTPAGNAMYDIDDVIPPGGENVPRRGPWDYTDGVPEALHDWLYDPYLGTSRFCGTCHDVTTERERVDDDGNGLGVQFNEQRTYSEWVNSDFAVPGDDFQTCQDCHMVAVPDMPGCSQYAGMGFSHESGGRRHNLTGINRFMVELLQAEFGSMGANILPDFYFDIQLEAQDAFIGTSATLEVEAPEAIDIGLGWTDLAVTVTNNTGHKLPSGYSEGRVMWLEVVAQYNDEVVVSSGLWDPETGQMQQDEQLRTYEGVGVEYDTGETFHLLLNNYWVRDTRIPPQGLVQDLETDPVGDRYVLRGDGTWPNFDLHTYAFPGLPELEDATPDDDSDDELAVSVRLLYVINTADYIDFLGTNGGDNGVYVQTLFDLAGEAGGAPPLVMAEQSLTIPISSFGEPGGTSTGGSVDTGDDTTSGPPVDTGDDDDDDADGTTGAPQGTTSGGGMTTSPMTTAGLDTSSGNGEGSTGDEAGADDDGGDGCGCRSQGSGAPAWTLFGLVGLGLARRRRRAV